VTKNLYVLTCGTFSATSAGKVRNAISGGTFSPILISVLPGACSICMSFSTISLMTWFCSAVIWIDRGGIGSLSSGGVWAMAPPTKNPAVNAIVKAARFIFGPIRFQRSMVSRDNHDGALAVPWREPRCGDGCCWVDKTISNDSRISMMAVHSNPASVMLRVAALALTIFVFSDGHGYAQSRATQGLVSSEGPFGQLAGNWSGSGTIDLSSGRREPIKCRASYDVLEEQNKLQLNIHCASDSYNFDLRGSATYAAGTIAGTWSELRA
jgi:hypothetical protein